MMMLRFLPGFVVCFCLCFTLCGQTSTPNIVPNPGFEQYSSAPLGWFYTGRDFTKVIRYWESPTAASPDVYGADVYVPSDWKRQGFGIDASHGGKSMIGITVYGCERGKPHCREYIQVQLNEALVPGQNYLLSYWTKPLPSSKRVQEVCAVVTKNRNFTGLDTLLDLTPTVMPPKILRSKSNDWMEVKAEFVAGGGEEFLVIGNFLNDLETHVEASEEPGSLAFAYYYIDDVTVKKIPPILDVPIPDDHLSKAVLETGKTIQLNNIYFDYDRDDFLPRSYQELDVLVDIMKDNPTMRIEIRGHTDNTGDSGYNNLLSESRARAVSNYLIDKGVEPNRLQSRGFGSSKPIASNTTEEGRQENRRVEFLILSK